MSATRCTYCPPTGTRCDSCLARDRILQMKSRIRLGRMPFAKCFRCLTVHPMPRHRGEYFCKLAPEWNGWPWATEENTL